MVGRAAGPGRAAGLGGQARRPGQAGQAAGPGQASPAGLANRPGRTDGQAARTALPPCNPLNWPPERPGGQATGLLVGLAAQRPGP